MGGGEKQAHRRPPCARGSKNPALMVSILSLLSSVILSEAKNLVAWFTNRVFKSPFCKGGFRGIFKDLPKIPPDPPLEKGGKEHQRTSIFIPSPPMGCPLPISLYLMGMSIIFL